MAESKQKYQPLKLNPNLATRKSKDAILRNETIQSDPCPVAVGTSRKDRTEADQNVTLGTILYL